MYIQCVAQKMCVLSAEVFSQPACCLIFYTYKKRITFRMSQTNNCFNTTYSCINLYLCIKKAVFFTEFMNSFVIIFSICYLSLFLHSILGNELGCSLQMVEQPQSSYRFRYITEFKDNPHGPLTGENSSKNSKTFPTVKVM